MRSISHQPKVWSFPVISLISVTILRLLLAAHFPITGDEAYYWQWSRHLSLGYHDHPPLIAWLLAIWQYLGGDNVFWLRILSLLLSTGTTIFVFLASLTLTNNHAAAYRGAILTIITPLFSLGGLSIIPDIPLLFFWSLSLYAFSQALALRSYSTGKKFWWILTGFSIGGAVLSKLTGFILLISFILFFIISKRQQIWLSSREFYYSIITAIITISPLIFWNAHNNWENFVYQFSHRAAPVLTFHRFPGYITLQGLLGFTPLLFLLAIFVWCKYLIMWRRDRDDKLLLLLITSGVIHLAAIFTGFTQRPGLHWAFPGTLSIFILLGIWVSSANKINKFYTFSIIVSILMTMSCYLLFFKPALLLSGIDTKKISSDTINKGKNLDSKELAEFIGYEELGQHIKVLKQQTANGKNSIIITTSYTLSSLLAYYSKEPAFVVFGSVVGSEYSRWINFKEHPGSNAIFVDFEPLDSRPEIAKGLKEAYESVQPLPPININKDGIGVRTYYAAYCRNLQKELPTQIP